MDNTEIPSSLLKMKDIFIECQTGHHSQASLIKAMTKIFGMVDENKFFVEFVKYVKQFLIVFKREPSVERAIDFIAKFSTSLQTGLADDQKSANEQRSTPMNDDTSQEEEDMHPFLLQLFRFLLENHKARDKAVRFRVCQLINRLFASLGDEAGIDDSLYEDVYKAMQLRLRDKFPVVRVHAVLALARLQDPSDPECPIIAAFKYMLEYDLSPEVRRAVMSSIAATTRTVSVMLERARDVKDVVRRLAYQVIAEKIHVRALTIAQRIRLLRQGLNDRNESVKNACKTQLIEAWLRTYNGNRIALLALLDVENSLDVCQQLLDVLFKKSSPMELTSIVDFLNEDKIIPDDKLSSESALYWRSLCEHLRSVGVEADDYLDKVLPNGVVYAKFLRGVAERLNTEQRLDDQLRNEFILQQLVHLIASLDLTDEVGRKCIIQVLRELLLSDSVTHTVVHCVITRYCALHSDSDTFVGSIAEIISDIREPIAVHQQDIGHEERRQNDLKIAAVRVELNQVREQLEECVEKQDFQQAAELKQRIVELETSRQALITEAEPQIAIAEVRTEKTDSQTLLKCLSIISELLTEPRFKKLTPSLQALMETLILPGIQNKDPAVRNQAVKSLVLCCLRSTDLARERIVLLLQVSRMDQQVVQLTALQGIFDLLHFFGLEIFKVEWKADKSDTSGTHLKDADGLKEEDESKVADGSHCSDDFDDVHSGSTTEPREHEKTDIGADILSILADLLDHTSPEVRTVCSEGLAKLLLSGRVVSPSLLSRLLLLWYNPVTEDDTRLRHCIGTFLPLYSFASRHNQEMVADAIMPTLQALFDAPSTSPLAEVKVANVADLLIELTDVHHPMASNQPPSGVVKDETPHDAVAIKIANEILSNPNSFDARILVKVLCSLRISSTNESILKDLKVLCRRMLKEVKDKLCLRSLEKFSRTIRDMIHRQQHPSNGNGDQENVFDTTQVESEEEIDDPDPGQSENGNTTMAGKRLAELSVNASRKMTRITTARSQRMKKQLMSNSRLSPDEEEDCSISEDDTENDETFASPNDTSKHGNGSKKITRQIDLDEMIDDDSDFEVPAQRSAKPATKASSLRSTSSKRKRSPLSEQSN